MENPPKKGEYVYIARLSGSDRGIIGHKFHVRQVDSRNYVYPETGESCVGGCWRYCDLEYVIDSTIYEIY